MIFITSVTISDLANYICDWQDCQKTTAENIFILPLIEILIYLQPQIKRLEQTQTVWK